MKVVCVLLYTLCATFCTASPIRILCETLHCENEAGRAVCGVRREGEGMRLRLFKSECELLKFGCSVSDEKAYGIINMEYCERTFNNTQVSGLESPGKFVKNIFTNTPKRLCINYDCSYPTDAVEVCAIREEGRGLKVRLFKDKCQLIKYNCENNLNFTITDLKICNGMDVSEDIASNDSKDRKVKNPLFVVDASMFHFNRNINETIENFFAMTHLLDLPVENLQRTMNESSRRMMIDIFGPQVVFQPWITIPTNISEDYYHTPTLSSCFHKCPTECPDTYAPVCGVPGIKAREPSLMFQNHCFMDTAQCKMRWEDKSSTAESSSYIESSFVFCVGDQMSNMFRFLPIIRTLQHMGRLKKKGNFRYRLRNMKFYNNHLSRQPKLMG